MTDKDIKDYCKNCGVEPPAMRFKCPECEYNLDKEIFAKDINVPHKNKKIIEPTLTEIKEIAESFCNACQEFEPEKKGSNCMYCNYGIILRKISEVGKVTDKEQIIIDGKGCRYRTWDKDCALTGDNHGDNMKPCKFIDEKNCYYKQSKRKEQECENLNKRVSSLEEIADDLQQRNHHLTQECKKLNNKIIDMNSIIEDAAINLGNKDFTLYDLPFKIKKLSQECEELKEKYEEIKEDRYNLNMEMYTFDRYRKVLEEIEKYCNNVLSFTAVRTTESDILDIINKAKEKNNETNKIYKTARMHDKSRNDFMC